MADSVRLYNLHVERRDKYLYAAVKAAPEGDNAPIAYIEAVTRHVAQHDCTSILIENHLAHPFALWDAVAVAPRFGRHLDDCIKLAIVEEKVASEGPRDLKIQMGRENVMTVRSFDTLAEAEEWLAE